MGAAAVRSILLGAALVSSANAEPLPGFQLVARTEHVSYYSRDGLKVDVGKTERYLRKVERLLGQGVSGHAEYYRHGDAAEIAAYTGQYAVGITFVREGRIHSTQEFHAHEIVHLVASQLGDPGVFFHEGLAMALTSEGRRNGQRLDRIAREGLRRHRPADFLLRFQAVDPDLAYAVAGSFVGHLIESDGIGKLTEFFRASTPDQGSRDDAFKRVFGRTLADATNAWQASVQAD